MKRFGILALALAALAAAPAGPRPTADVTAVSVLSAPGRAEVVVDISDVVEVSDFVLNAPDRLVLDLVGARLVAPVVRYDGVTRAGIRNVRYAQFRPDVVRIVLELDEARDYSVQVVDGAVRVAMDAGEPFAGWSTVPGRARTMAAGNAAAPSRPAIAPGIMPEPPPPAAARTQAQEAAPQQSVSQMPPFSVTFDRATIQEVVQTFALFSGRSIILGANISGEVTAEVRNQPWDVAFFSILRSQGLAATEDPGGIIRVGNPVNLVAGDSTEPTMTRVIRINYARATAIAGSVAPALTPNRGRSVADTVTNSIIITDLASRMPAIDSFVRTLDIRTPQVAIQAKIIFVDRTDLEDLGVRYDMGTNDAFFNTLLSRPNLAADPTGATPFDPASTPYAVTLQGASVAAIGNARATLPNGNPALNLILSTAIGNFSLTSFLEALQQATLADVQAEPSITVADNRPAELFSGERTPIRQVDAGAAGGAGITAARATTTFQETGIRLTVTPHVVRETREVLLEAAAERSQVTPSALSEIGAVFSRQVANTQLLVRDGETAVIGGLTVTEVSESRSGIPILMDLPVVGRLFSFTGHKEVRRDLLILITPHIVDDVIQSPPAGSN